MSNGVAKKPDDDLGGEWVFDPKAVLVRYRKWFPEFNDEIMLKILTYQSDLVKFNRAVNLVSPSTIRNAEALHFADSINACKIIQKHLIADHPVYDFGSGNGFPGMILAILNPTIKVILIDRDTRKLEFCKHVATNAKIGNVTAQAINIEELPEKSIYNVVARGFAPLHKSLLVTRKQVRKGGRFFHMKGDGWANELAQVPSQLFSHWSPSLIGQYRIPETSVDLAVVLTEKTAE